jgi:(2Fe-2S) ferredoxin
MKDELKKGFKVPPSKIVQIAAADNDVLNALCEDGSVLSFWSDGMWYVTSPAPAKPVKADETLEKMKAMMEDLKFDPPPPDDQHFTTCKTSILAELHRKARLWDVLWQLKANGRIHAAVEDDQCGRFAYNAETAADLLERLAGEVKP